MLAHSNQVSVCDKRVHPFMNFGLREYLHIRSLEFNMSQERIEHKRYGVIIPGEYAHNDDN